MLFGVIPRPESAFVDWLAARHATVARLRAEHVDYYDELLPHVLFFDITNHAGEVAGRADTDAEAARELGGLLEDLDDVVREGRGDEVESLVWVSFVECANEEPLRKEIRRFPNLARVLRHFEILG
jgi:hypothetical protein